MQSYKLNTEIETNTWIDNDGKTWKLKDMGSQHIANAIRWMRNHAPGYAALHWNRYLLTHEDASTFFDINHDTGEIEDDYPERPHPNDDMKYLEEEVEIYQSLKKELDKRGFISDIVELNR